MGLSFPPRPASPPCRVLYRLRLRVPAASRPRRAASPHDAASPPRRRRDAAIRPRHDRATTERRVSFRRPPGARGLRLAPVRTRASPDRRAGAAATRPHERRVLSPGASPGRDVRRVRILTRPRRRLDPSTPQRRRRDPSPPRQPSGDRASPRPGAFKFDSERARVRTVVPPRRRRDRSAWASGDSCLLRRTSVSEPRADSLHKRVRLVEHPRTASVHPAVEVRLPGRARPALFPAGISTPRTRGEHFRIVLLRHRRDGPAGSACCPAARSRPAQGRGSPPEERQPQSIWPRAGRARTAGAAASRSCGATRARSSRRWRTSTSRTAAPAARAGSGEARTSSCSSTRAGRAASNFRPGFATAFKRRRLLFPSRRRRRRSDAAKAIETGPRRTQAKDGGLEERLAAKGAGLSPERLRARRASTDGAGPAREIRVAVASASRPPAESTRDD